MARRWKYLPADKRRAIMKEAARGATYREIIDRCGVSMGSTVRVLVPLGGVIRRSELDRPATRLSLDDRVNIRLGLADGWSYRRIGASLPQPRSASTICREVNAAGGRHDYRPMDAHRAAGQRARRPKPTKLAANPRLCARVSADLKALWSPQQISERLRAQFGDDPDMQVSHETIYKSIYVQGRGELRRELARCLRTGRAKRVSQGRIERRGQIADKVMISQRPAEVADRAVPGHWEGDLIIGKNTKSAVGTLVERSTRYVLLLHLPDGHGAQQVRAAMVDAIGRLPDSLWRSLTWDQGKEMAHHVQLTTDTGMQVYFCDPRSPWQRGSNENTNGLLRQYMPKGTNLSVHTRSALHAIEDSINSRPRKTLDWMTPSEKLAELIVASTG